jgi:hypothetical protein
MFIDPKVSRATNEWVASQDKDIPSFRRTSPGLVEVNGAILRYSSTSA